VTDTSPEPAAQFSVGGVRMRRPFKIRRFGHVGLNLEHLSEAAQFYIRDIGFRATEELDGLKSLPDHLRETAQSVVTDPRMYFASNSSDHHALLLLHRSFDALLGNDEQPDDCTLNQITWQVGSLSEVVDGAAYLRERGVRILRVGRDMPGSNWAVYFLDPDGNSVELYYGIEQVGWARNSKPAAMYYRMHETAPALPQASEAAEVREALEKGIDIFSGWRPDESELEEKYDVGGVVLPRPFKVTRLGPMSMFTDRLDEMTAFYTDYLGFSVTERTGEPGRRAVFLRNGTEHHSLVLLDKSLRSELRLSPHTSCMAIGMEVGSYEQLRAAVGFLRGLGYTLVDIPAELYTGIDYAAHVRDPDGHLVQLYYYMEQVGWDGRPRPVEQRRKVSDPWPETLAALEDTYVDQVFLGPIG
jgi:catechol 2,3-dioxygenase-like lactoylglutathione lyase family enzyme